MPLYCCSRIETTQEDTSIMPKSKKPTGGRPNYEPRYGEKKTSFQDRKHRPADGGSRGAAPAKAGTVPSYMWSAGGTVPTLRASPREYRRMSFLIVLAALCFLMLVAYRGYSVILFAPVAALGAVLLTDPTLVAPMFTGLFMDKMVGFLKLYFPVFLLGAIFGKLIEVSGFSKSIVAATIRLFGPARAMLSIVTVCALLTYGGVSLFVVVFAVYPFAAELFRQSDIPKRLIPGTIALGAFTFTMDALPGTPQIQNIIPASFFGTTAWAAPVLGTLGGAFILGVGLVYLEWRRRKALADGGRYGSARQGIRGLISRGQGTPAGMTSRGFLRLGVDLDCRRPRTRPRSPLKHSSEDAWPGSRSKTAWRRFRTGSTWFAWPRYAPSSSRRVRGRCSRRTTTRTS